MVNLRNKKTIIGAVVALVLAGCGGFVYTTVGGEVKGLILDTLGNLILANEGNFSATPKADGPFSFKVASNAAYEIRVVAQPNQVNCTLVNGVGRMTSETPVTNVAVTCVPNVPVGGTINGLVRGTTITLNNNDGAADFSRTDPVQPASPPFLPDVDPKFTLAHYVVNGQAYKVAVLSQPAAQVCSVTNGEGVANNTNLAAAKNVAVNCVAGVPVTVKYGSDLKASGRITLSNNDNDSLTVTQAAVAVDGTGTFNKSLLNGASYNVKVSAHPFAQFCSVTGATGIAAMGGSPVTPVSVGVSCVDAMSVTGTLTGLKIGASLTLVNNAGDPLTMFANGIFIFANSLLVDRPYQVTVATQPTGQICTVSNGTGKALITTPVTDPKIVVNCI